MTVRFLPAAQAELLEGISYCSAIRPELGVRFEQAVSHAVRSAVAYPDHGAPRTKNTRRWLVRGFPFGVIYRTNDEEVVIVAVAHQRKRPRIGASEWTCVVCDSSISSNRVNSPARTIAKRGSMNWRTLDVSGAAAVFVIRRPDSMNSVWMRS
jgi:toxin ParE2